MVKRMGECNRLLVEGGLDGDDLQAVNDDPAFRQLLLRCWKDRGRSVRFHLDTLSQCAARHIMGPNYLSIDDVERCFGVAYTPEMLDKLAEVPFPAEALRSRAADYVLVPGFPLSPNEVERIGEEYDARWICTDPSSLIPVDDAVLNTAVDCRWHLIRADAMFESTGEVYDRKVEMLQGNEYVPSTSEVVYMIALYFLARGVRLMEDGVLCRGCLEPSHVTSVRNRRGGMLIDGFYSTTGRTNGIAVAVRP
jgi:hypothetical protein